MIPVQASNRTATGALREDHRLILAVAAVLERILGGTDPSAEDLAAIEECITFFRLFADACHHGSEEDLLFTALEEEGIPREAGPVAALIEEHRLGRELVARMAVAMKDARAGNPAAMRAVADAGEQYISMIRLHITKEDDGLFDLADGVVHGPACRVLCEAYDAVCRQSFDGRTRAQLENLGRALVERYGAS